MKYQVLNFLSTCLRRFKQPIMVWGYKNPSGAYVKKTRVSDTALMQHPERISIGDNVFISHYSILDGTGGLTIGEGTGIGPWVGIFTHSAHIAIRLYGSHYQEIPEKDKLGYQVHRVIIGKYVFVGAGAKILPGVVIGDGAVIGVGSIVSKNVNCFEVVSGNPAQVIGDARTLDEPYLRDDKIKTWYEEWQKN